MSSTGKKYFRVIQIKGKVSWQVEELWDGGIIRGPYNSSETAISNENKIAQQEGFMNDLELKEIIAGEITEEERAEPLARYNARKRGETAESDDTYSTDNTVFQLSGDGKYVLVEGNPLKGGKQWVDRHLNLTWFLLNVWGGFFAGLWIGFFGMTLIAYIIVSIILFTSTLWLLDRKEQSMWHMLLIFVPFGWVILLALTDKSYQPTYKQEKIPSVNWEFEERYIHNRGYDEERAWTEVIQDLVGKGEVPKNVLNDTDSALWWWRNISSAKQDEISKRVELIVSRQETIGDF